MRKASALSAGDPRAWLWLCASGAALARRLRPSPKFRESLGLFELTKYAAVWRAVAAADRRAACARAFVSFWAQSGRILSVVTTFGSLADRDVARRRPGTVEVGFADDSDDVDDDMGDARLAAAAGREVGSVA